MVKDKPQRLLYAPLHKTPDSRVSQTPLTRTTVMFRLKEGSVSSNRVGGAEKGEEHQRVVNQL